MNIKYVLILLLFTFPVYLYSQYSPEIDSLIKVTKKMPDDTDKLINLNLISNKLKKKDLDAAIKYGQEAVNLAQKLNDIKQEALAYKNIGVAYYHKSNYPVSYDYFTKSLKLFREIGDSLNTAKVIRNIGSVFSQQGNYEKALEYFFKSLKLRKILGDDKGVASLYNAIGLIYLNQGKEMSDKALKYFKQALSIYLELNDKKGIALSYNRIGAFYYELSNPEYDTALSYYEKMLSIAKELKNPRLIAQANESIGLTYLKKEDKKAYPYLKKSEELYSQIGNGFGLSDTYQHLGEYYLFINDYQEALKYLQKAIDLAKHIESPAIEKNSYETLTRLYEKEGNYKKAYEYYKKFNILKDSLQGAEIVKEISQLEAQRDFEKAMKEKELEEQKMKLEHDNKLKRQKLISFTILIVLLFMIALTIVIFRNYRNKQKANELLIEKNKKISEQQEQITASIKYAQHIQKALLPPDDILTSYFPNHFVLFKPRDIVSGDFYWVNKKDNVIFIAAVDCTGHGVPGAFMSMLGIAFLNEIINKNPLEKLSAANILEQLRTYVKTSLRQTGKDNEAKDGMDIALCSIDTEKNEMQFAGAQNPLIIIRNNEAIQYKGDRMPVGIYIFEKPFTNHIIDIKKNDRFYIFSDGFIDQFGGKNNKKFMIKNFRKLLLEINEKPMNQQKQILEKTLTEWIQACSDCVQTDDILVIGVQY